MTTRFFSVFLVLAFALSCSEAPNFDPSLDQGIDVSPDQAWDMAKDSPDRDDADREPDLEPDQSTDVGVDTSSPAPFGGISGTCGELDSVEIDASTPFFFENVITFDAEFIEDDDLDRLTDGGQEIVADGNAGGSSLYSEVFSYEVLSRCEMAGLLKTETEITYDTQGKITDLLVAIETHKLGVSVTRAVSFPRDTPYTIQRAQNLLEGKLDDILVSSANVAAEDRWEKQILHVMADRAEHVASLRAAWEQIDAMTKANTIVYVTVTEGTDDFIY